MDNLLAKLSSYNLFNNLLPGAVFCTGCSYLGVFSIDPSNLVALFIVYYFVGLVIGRIGSIVIEPLFHLLTWTKFPPYDHFVAATKRDEKIEILVETSNTYRGVLTSIVCLAATIGIVETRRVLPANSLFDELTILLGLVVLFGLAYRKQSAYITKRVAVSRGQPEIEPQK